MSYKLKRISSLTLSLAFVLTVLSACAVQRFHLAEGYERANFVDERYQAFFLSGIGQSDALYAKQVCGGGDKILAVEFQQSFGNSLVAGLTNGLFTPRTGIVYCKK